MFCSKLRHQPDGTVVLRSISFNLIFYAPKNSLQHFMKAHIMKAALSPTVSGFNQSFRTRRIAMEPAVIAVGLQMSL